MLTATLLSAMGLLYERPPEPHLAPILEDRGQTAAVYGHIDYHRGFKWDYRPSPSSWLYWKSVYTLTYRVPVKFSVSFAGIEGDHERQRALIDATAFELAQKSPGQWIFDYRPLVYWWVLVFLFWLFVTWLVGWPWPKRPVANR